MKYLRIEHGRGLYLETIPFSSSHCEVIACASCVSCMYPGNFDTFNISYFLLPSQFRRLSLLETNPRFQGINSSVPRSAPDTLQSRIEPVHYPSAVESCTVNDVNLLINVAEAQYHKSSCFKSRHTCVLFLGIRD